MTGLPDWWNELIEWFRTTRESKLPLNMAHAWRVSRYADRVCNAGFADYLSTCNRELPAVIESLSVVAGEADLQILNEAIAFRSASRQKRRLPRVAWVPRAIAYDGLFRGWPQEQVVEALAELAPSCPSRLYPAILEVAAGEVAALAEWERLNARFYDQEHRLRLRIAEFSERHFQEWRG